MIGKFFKKVSWKYLEISWFFLKSLLFSIVFVLILLILSFSDNFLNIENMGNIISIFTNTEHSKKMIFFVIAFIFESSLLMLLSFVSLEIKNFFVILWIGVMTICVYILDDKTILTHGPEYYNIFVLLSLFSCVGYKTISMYDLKKIKHTIQ